jgi:hypothetical protein
MVRLGFAVVVRLIDLLFAHLAFWAWLILLRAEADNVRRGFV